MFDSIFLNSLFLRRWLITYLPQFKGNFQRGYCEIQDIQICLEVGLAVTALLPSMESILLSLVLQ